jgi:hypothetical protein
MKASEIVVGGIYVAKVSSKLTRVRVESIETDVVTGYKAATDYSGKWGRLKRGTRYHVVNMLTGRQLTFRSAGKFRKPAAA